MTRPARLIRETQMFDLYPWRPEAERRRILAFFRQPFLIIYPRRRKAARQRALAYWNQCQIERDEEAARLRRLGASEAAVFHCCYDNGEPDARWIRIFWVWLHGDFSSLWILLESRRQRKARSLARKDFT